MSVTSTESPILQALLPAEKIKSWALEVEMEESREFVHTAAKTSPKGLDKASRDTRKNFISEEDKWRQSSSVSKHTTSPDCSRRSLQSRDRVVPLHRNAHHTDIYMLKTGSTSNHILADKNWPKGIGKKGHDYWKQSNREEIDCMNRSDQARQGYATHGYHRMSQSSHVVDRSQVVKWKSSTETPAEHGRQGCSRSQKLERKGRNYEGHRHHSDSGRGCHDDSGYFHAEVKAWSGKSGHRELNGSDLPMSAIANEKFSKFEKEDGKPPACLETGSHNRNQKSKHNLFVTLFESAVRTDIRGTPLELNTTSSQVECESDVYSEAPSKKAEIYSSCCANMMEQGRDAEDNSKGDVARSDSKKEYEMLASLLLDDSLDIDQDFDVILAASGAALPDSMYCGSIFGDDLELPAVSMDIESLAEVRTGISADGSINMSATNSAELKGPQLPKICGLDGGLNVNLPKPVSSTDNLVQNHVRSEDIGSRLAEKLKASSNIAEAQPFSRVFVDVTNTFKIPDGPAFNGKTEEDARRISQRQRQVDFGKNTLGYERYTELVPRCKRKQRDPQTPDPKQVCSKRSWDGQIRKWRRLLHVYDPPREHGEEEAEDFSTDRTILPKDADSKRMNASQGLSRSKYSIEKDANFTIYDDWNE